MLEMRSSGYNRRVSVQSGAWCKQGTNKNAIKIVSQLPINERMACGAHESTSFLKIGQNTHGNLLEALVGAVFLDKASSLVSDCSQSIINLMLIFQC